MSARSIPQRLIKEGVITEAELQELIAERIRRYEDALGAGKASRPEERERRLQL